MKFKIWLEGIEEYDPYRGAIEAKAASRRFPFGSWWTTGEDRVYIPFNPQNADLNKTEKDIKEIIEDFKGYPSKGLPAATQYELVDYKRGLAKPLGGKNTYKIMRILSAIEELDILNYKQKLDNGEMSELKYNDEVASTKRFIDKMAKDFQSDATRIKSEASSHFIVISKNIHDIASMSTGRGWTSCMNLAGGSHSDSVYCEVVDGGFIAYIVKAGDKNIRNPVSRLHIRRFDNKTGQSYAVPEDSVYGAEMDGFYEAVVDWIESKQGKIPLGQYKRKGGSYSDTFGDKRMTYLTSQSNDPKYYIKMIKRYIALPSEDKYKKSVVDKMELIIDDMVKFTNTEEYPANLIMKLAKIKYPKYFDDTLNLTLAGTGICGFINKFPQIVTQELVNKIFDANKDDPKSLRLNCSRILLQKFSKFLDAEKLNKLKITQSDIGLSKVSFSPEILEDLKKSAIRDAISGDTLNIDKLDPAIMAKDEPYYTTLGDINDLTEKLKYAKPVPPEAVRKLVAYYNDWEKLKAKMDAGNRIKQKDKFIAIDGEKLKHKLAQYFMHLFNMTNTDIPAVVEFYKTLMPEFMLHGGAYDGLGIGKSIARLGINGTPFLPFFEKLKKGFEQIEITADNENKKKAISGGLERVNYIIEQIKTDRVGSKYDGRSSDFDVAIEEEAYENALKL
jgi:hypothetical protein